MNVRIKATSCQDIMLARNDIRVGSNYHIRVNICHHIWITRFANPDDDTVLDAHVSFVDASPVHHKCVRDHGVETVRISSPCCLTHAISDSLAAAERAFIAVVSKVLLDLDPQICCSQPNQVSSGWAIHALIRYPVHTKHVDARSVTDRRRSMGETCFLQSFDKLFWRMLGDMPGCEPVTAFNDLLASDLHESDRLCISRFEAHRCPSCDVEPEAMCLCSVELELRIRLDKVVM